MQGSSPAFFYEKKQNCLLISLAQRNRAKETSTPSKASPYMGRMQPLLLSLLH